MTTQSMPVALDGQSPPFTTDEMMTVAAARALTGRRTCFVGIGLPSRAANLARRLHAPQLILIYESGTIGATPSRLPLSIGDGELAETAGAVVSVPEIFAYWLQGGRVEVGFLGAAQIDRYASINTTVIGSYDEPKVRLPGAGGAPEIAGAAREVIVVLRHQRRAFVEQLDFVTSVGHRSRGRDRAELGLTGRGPTMVITDLGTLRPGDDGELELVAVHPGTSVEAAVDATGWPLRVATDVATTPPPSSEELAVLRTLEGGS